MAQAFFIKREPHHADSCPKPVQQLICSYLTAEKDHV